MSGDINKESKQAGICQSFTCQTLVLYGKFYSSPVSLAVDIMEGHIIINKVGCEHLTKEVLF